MSARRYWCADDYVADAALAGPGPFDGARLFVLAADHDRIVAEAEARGWNAAITSALTWLERVDHYWLGVGSEGQDTMVKYWQLKPQIAALRKPEVEG